MYFRRHRVDPCGDLDQRLRALKDLMVLDDQNGPAKEQIESDVVALGMSDRFAKEQRKASISKHGRLGEFTDREPNRLLRRVRNRVLKFHNFHAAVSTAFPQGNFQ